MATVLNKAGDGTFPLLQKVSLDSADPELRSCCLRNQDKGEVKTEENSSNSVSKLVRNICLACPRNSNSLGKMSVILSVSTDLAFGCLMADREASENTG